MVGKIQKIDKFDLQKSVLFHIFYVENNDFISIIRTNFQKLGLI